MLFSVSILPRKVPFAIDALRDLFVMVTYKKLLGFFFFFFFSDQRGRILAILKGEAYGLKFLCGFCLDYSKADYRCSPCVDWDINFC